MNIIVKWIPFVKFAICGLSERWMPLKLCFGEQPTTSASGAKMIVRQHILTVQFSGGEAELRGYAVPSRELGTELEGESIGAR